MGLDQEPVLLALELVLALALVLALLLVVVVVVLDPLVGGSSFGTKTDGRSVSTF